MEICCQQQTLLICYPSCDCRFTMLLSTEQINLIGTVFESYVLEHHKNDLLQILREKDEDAHYPVIVDALTLFETSMEIGDYFNAFPSEVLPVFDNALRRTAMTVFQSASQAHDLTIKQHLHARITGQTYFMRFLQILCGTVDNLSVLIPCFKMSLN